MNRRTFLKDAGLLAGGLAASSMLPDMAHGRTQAAEQAGRTHSSTPTPAGPTSW